MPRKGTPRSGSSSSIASSSSSSTITAPPPQSNGSSFNAAGDLSGWGARKKLSRGVWPAGKAEPISGVSTARPHPVASSSSGPSAASAMSAIHQPSPILPSQHMSQTQQNGGRGAMAQGQGESPAILHLLPMNGTFERKTITVPFFPDVMRIGRQTNAKTIPTPVNGYFDSKVLSRQHAEVWADRNGKIWIRDVKSSNGTFVNGQRLSAENRDSEPHELREQDLLELGIDIVHEDQKTIMHHKVAARVEHAGIYGTGTNVLDLNFGDIDPTAGGGLMAPPLSQNLAQLRGRTGSQGSLGSNGRIGAGTPSVAGSNMNAMSQQRHTNFWLTPVTMEQIVKKLTTELRAAKQQSNELQRTGEYFNTLLTDSPKEDGKQPQPNRPHFVNGGPLPSRMDHKARFSDPPAPPPQQPLPEKPDAARLNTESNFQPNLRRSDTERPKSGMNGSPTRPDSSHQIVSLIEALATAKKEIDSQGARVKDLEDLLIHERLARESAEELAKRLQSASQEQDGDLKDGAGELDTTSEEDGHSVNGVIPGLDEFGSSDAASPSKELKEETQEDTSVFDASTARLQQRLELMVAEMDEMKQQIEKYKQRAEVAEEERATDRKSLAEMVEKIRRDDAEREAKALARRRSTEMSTQTEKVSNDGDVDESASAEALIARVDGQNGKAISPDDVANLKRVVSTALARSRGPHDQLTTSAPYASILGVVVLGVGLMAFLNGWQKVDR
ncbi:MAG: hypothetical protein M1819_003716 [Sarea resinae]|nr:MAG: hypothetical protein M1819_003716 [Sarea resinae]